MHAQDAWTIGRRLRQIRDRTIEDHGSAVPTPRGNESAAQTLRPVLRDIEVSELPIETPPRSLAELRGEVAAVNAAGTACDYGLLGQSAPARSSGEAVTDLMRRARRDAGGPNCADWPTAWVSARLTREIEGRTGAASNALAPD